MFINKVAGRSSKPRSEDSYRLNELNNNMKPPSDSHAASHGKAGTSIESGQRSQASDEAPDMEGY